MAKWRFEAACSLGIRIRFDIAQGSTDYDFAAVDSGAWPKINNVVGVPHCFVIVLDNDE